MEGLQLSGLPENWLSLKPINSSDEEEDDGKVILELRLGSNSSDQGSPKPFEHRRPMNRSSETAVNENRTFTSFPSEEEETKCPVCYKSFRSMKAMHGHMRCHTDRGWRGVNPPPPPHLLPPSSAMSASSPPPTRGVRRGKRGQKGSISDSSKKLKMDEKGASSGSTYEENYDSWKEFLTLGLNYGEEEEKEKESEKKEEASSSSTSFVEQKEKEKEKEEGHKCKICKKSFLTGQALGGHQTTQRRKSSQSVFPEAQYCKTMTS